MTGIIVGSVALKDTSSLYCRFLNLNVKCIEKLECKKKESHTLLYNASSIFLALHYEVTFVHVQCVCTFNTTLHYYTNMLIAPTLGIHCICNDLTLRLGHYTNVMYS